MAEPTFRDNEWTMTWGSTKEIVFTATALNDEEAEVPYPLTGKALSMTLKTALSQTDAEAVAALDETEGLVVSGDDGNIVTATLTPAHLESLDPGASYRLYVDLWDWDEPHCLAKGYLNVTPTVTRT